MQAVTALPAASSDQDVAATRQPVLHESKWPLAAADDPIGKAAAQ